MFTKLKEHFEKWFSKLTPATICGIISMIFLFATLFMYLILTFATLPRESCSSLQVLYIESNKPAYFKTTPKFLSIALDSIIIAMGFKNFNMTNVKLMKMMEHLAPGYLRIGGTLADKLYFSPNDQLNESVQNFYRTLDNERYHPILPKYIMAGSPWLQLTKLAENANLDIFFDLNSLIRFKNGSWDYQNAESLIKFSNSHRLKVNWELGNEPNSFRHKFNEVVNATQMASDFAMLRTILNDYPSYKNSLLIGPDVTRPRKNHKESEKYLKEFLQNSANAIDAVSWHQYYLNGRTAQVEDFLNPKIFDYLKYEIKTVRDIVSSSQTQVTNIYLGETSSAYGGGAPQLSDSFVGSFIWVDKLGLAAKMGIKVVMRQSIFHGNYALLDENYDPNPDWWVSVIYKKLVGPEVVSYHTTTTPTVRLYVHCSKRPLCSRTNNSITVMGINLGGNVSNIKIVGLLSDNIKVSSIAYVYELTSENLLSKSVLLNDKLLKMSPDNSLPVFTPILKRTEPFITMSPHSIAFWVIPNTDVKACL